MANIEKNGFDGTGLPFSNEAEQSVLGAILIDPPSLKMVDKLKPEHFYIPNNREIFSTLLMMDNSSEPIDFITVLEQLKKTGKFDSAGGKAYLTTLVECVPSSANINYYAGIVTEKYYVRALITASRDIIDMASDVSTESEKLLESAEQKIYEIRQGRDVSDLKPIKEILAAETLSRISKLSNPETRAEYIGIPTGFSGLDRLITGLNKSDLIIIGARPGMGKTAFALNIARNVAVQQKKTVCFFSLEMSRDQLAQRLLSSEALIESSKFRTGELTGDEWLRVTAANEILADASIFVDETPGITVNEIKAKLKRMKNVDLVIIDYLGLVQSSKRTENRVQEVSEITRSLKVMAKELKVPVIACAQLNRGGTEAKGKGASHRPSLSDLRDSGSIEQDADIVLFMFREQYYQNENPEKPVDEHSAECIVAKNRHGGLDKVPLYWDGQFTRFSTVDTTGNG